MIDSLYFHLGRSRESPFVDQLNLRERQFGLVTLHRPSNVDDADQFQELLRALKVIAEDLPLVFPVHPRTRARIRAGDVGRERLLDPVGYLDFVSLMSSSALVLTDSGGIQDETTALGIPCLTLRNNTERPVTVENGTNVLAGTTYESIMRLGTNTDEILNQVTSPSFGMEKLPSAAWKRSAGRWARNR